jgi:predicted nucleic acid-binding protein
MSGKAFLDNNILVYLHSGDEAEKQAASLELIGSHACYTSVQALNEFSNVCLKKLKKSREEIEESFSKIAASCIVSKVTINTLRRALRLHERYGYSLYDCLMLASALEIGCETIFTEDLSAGQIIESVLTVVNPFLE